ncbi:SDR family NAD(P)-dependent oxidoreductase [Streptomyces sulphureus]|uniref:SDR family NAD(P)-dependent oxidoreductase n=1 Tax=Streptomyces sulphureus TaxID=47758 RepID=UPI00035C1E6B|nr:SDR family oxidoreductase [Streptomyces sulphureus]
MSAEKRFDGDRALVVGGYGGIGALVCRSLAEEGARVAVAGRSKERAEEVARSLGPGSGSAHTVDVRDPADVRRLVAEVTEEFGGLDLLVNSASALVVAPATEIGEEDWRAVVETNLLGAFWLSQAVGRSMVAAGGGRIVHLSSVRGTLGARRGFSAYGASKAGLNLLVQQLAAEWGQHGVRVNAVAPGFVRTDFVSGSAQDEQFMRMLVGRIPLGRTAEAEEIASAVTYLASPEAAFVTGQILHVDGGVTASQ